MEFMEVLESRRSIRKYQNKPVSKELVKEIIRAAIYAPSWKNSQTARYHVVMSEDLLKAFKESCLPEFNRHNCQDAPILIVSTFIKSRSGFDRDGHATNEVGQGWGYYDCGLHNQVLLLRAKELGLDTLVMGIRDEAKIRNLLHIDPNEIIVSVIALGYRDIEPEMPKRKTVEDIVTFY